MVQSLIQGLIVNVKGGTYALQTQNQEVMDIHTLPTTVNNGWPKVGDHALVMLNGTNQALVMTRFFYSCEQAA